MRRFFKRLALAPQGLRYKLLIAFSLMSLIPLLILVYVVSNYINVFEDPSITSLSIIVIISVGIAWLGLLLAKNIVEPIIDLSIEAKIIASGDFDRKITTQTRDDEIGDLGGSINLLVKRIKDNIGELKDYGERTREINLEIQKKMVTLYDVLQVSDLIAASADLEKVLDVVLDKLSNFYARGFAITYLLGEKADEFVMRGFDNVHDNTLINTTIKLGEDFLGTIARRKKTVIIDSSTPRSSAEYAFKSKHKLVNAVIMPIYTGKEIRGLLMCGNYIKEFTYTNEDIDILNVFAKHLSIAFENNMLTRKADKLTTRDDLTGLYNENHISLCLNEEIERAVMYQRPCSLILIDIDNFKEHATANGQLGAEAILKEIANLLKRTIAEPIDKAGRIGDDKFAVILPEKNKKRAIDIAEQLRKAIEVLKIEGLKHDRLTASMGVSENPLDGSSAAQLLEKATSFIKKAKSQEKNKVIS